MLRLEGATRKRGHLGRLRDVTCSDQRVGIDADRGLDSRHDDRRMTMCGCVPVGVMNAAPRLFLSCVVMPVQ